MTDDNMREQQSLEYLEAMLKFSKATNKKIELNLSPSASLSFRMTLHHTMTMEEAYHLYTITKSYYSK